MSEIDKVCKALHRYYTAMGQADSYLEPDESGEIRGKFSVWCESNGMDDETLLEEFAADPLDSLLCDFADDKDMPLPPHQAALDGDQRRQAVFAILEQCHTNPDGVGLLVMNNAAEKAQHLTDFEQEEFDAIKEADIKRVRQIYTKYCPIIANKELGRDMGLLTMLAFQHRHKRHDYLLNLVDSYNRYRVLHDPTIGARVWGALADNAHFQAPALKKLHITIPTQQKARTNYLDFATMCVQSFTVRMVPLLTLQHHQEVIDDSIQHIVSYLTEALDFVVSLFQNEAICPFQVDFSIAVGQPKKMQTAADINMAAADIDDDDDDDDDGDGDAEHGGDNEQKQREYEDWVQDVEGKLKENQLRYSILAPDTVAKRKFGLLFQQFATEHNINLQQANGSHYLHHKRLIAFIDRRKSKQAQQANQDRKKDRVYMYEPPTGEYTHSIPAGDDFVQEWFISSSTTCILPNVGYDAEGVVGNKMTNDANNEKAGANVGAATGAAGGMLTFSFHAFSVDKVKLYLYWNGGMIRFFPSDITRILPGMFVQSAANKKYIADKDGMLAHKIKQMETKLVDSQFEEWLKVFPVPQTTTVHK